MSCTSRSHQSNFVQALWQCGSWTVQQQNIHQVPHNQAVCQVVLPATRPQHKAGRRQLLKNIWDFTQVELVVHWNPFSSRFSCSARLCHRRTHTTTTYTQEPVSISLVEVSSGQGQQPMPNNKILGSRGLRDRCSGGARHWRLLPRSGRYSDVFR